MAPEYGATIGYFPVDQQSLDYLHQTGRSPSKIQIIKGYLEAQGLLKDYSVEEPLVFSGEVLVLDLATVVPSLAGPKRPNDRVAVSALKHEFLEGLNKPVSFKSYGLAPGKEKDLVEFIFKGEKYSIDHGSVVLCAITSCTNTSNPGVMLAAGILAKNAVNRGLK
jgi:aconitate hydratase